MSQWKITEKTIHKADLFEVKEQTITGKNKTKKYQIVQRRPTVLVFPLTSSNEIYLLSQYRTLFDKIILEAVAGHVDPGENPLKAAKRELKEEAGISARQWEELLRVESSASVVRSNMHLFLAKGLEEGESNLGGEEEDEEIVVIKMSLSEAINKIVNREIVDGPTIIGLLFLDKLRREKKL